MVTQFLSNHCILYLVVNVKIQSENVVVCMGSLLFSSGRNSAYFDTSCLKLSIHTPILRYSFTPFFYNKSP